MPLSHWAVRFVSGVSSFETKASTLMRDFESCMDMQRTTAVTSRAWNACKPKDFSKSMIVKGLYDAQLRIWLDAFPLGSFCIMSAEFFQLNTTQALSVLTEFLEIPPHDWSALSLGNHTRVDQAPITVSPVAEEEIRQFFKKYDNVILPQIQRHHYIGCDTKHADLLQQAKRELLDNT
jgi:hypothetical protein